MNMNCKKSSKTDSATKGMTLKEFRITMRVALVTNTVIFMLVTALDGNKKKNHGKAKY